MKKENLFFKHRKSASFIIKCQKRLAAVHVDYLCVCQIQTGGQFSPVRLGYVFLLLKLYFQAFALQIAKHCPRPRAFSFAAANTGRRIAVTCGSTTASGRVHRTSTCACCCAGVKIEMRMRFIGIHSSSCRQLMMSHR